MQAGELMQDYKTGHLVHASPRGQFFGQVIGSTAGVFVSTLTYKVSFPPSSSSACYSPVSNLITLSFAALAVRASLSSAWP